jgi:hypothetical protein
MNYLLPVTGGTIAAEAAIISRTQRIGPPNSRASRGV